MVNPVSSSYAQQVTHQSQPAAQQARKSAQNTLPQDTVTLKSTDVDHDGDSK